VDEQPTQNRSPAQYRIGAAIFFFISGFGYSTWASRIPTIKQQLHLDNGQLGTALLALPVGLMLTMPFTKWLLTRYSSRAVMLFGSLFLCAILILIGFAASYWQLLMLLLFFGSARNLMTLSINTQGVTVQALYPKSIMAAFHGIWSLACFAAAGLSLILVPYNVTPAYQFTLVSIVLAAVSLYFIRDTINQQPDPQQTLQEEQSSPWWVRAYALPDRYLLKFALICFACMACENTMYDWSAVYFQKQVNPDKIMYTGALVVFLTAVTIGRFFGDRIVNAIGIKKVLNYSGILIFCGLAITVAFPFVPTVALGYILVGFGVCCVVPMVFSLAGKSKNMSSSSALASISTVGYMGFIIIPPFVGWVAKAVSLRLSFGIVTFFGLLIVYLVTKIKEDSNADDAADITMPDS
jgi:MFS family permease